LSVQAEPEVKPASSSQGTQTSIFGIIVLGLIGGLIVGLIVGPSLTLNGFFLGFAGGALIAASLYWYATGNKRPSK
jgi:uncharacterized membrane protein SpoIIM required for sporulation